MNLKTSSEIFFAVFCLLLISEISSWMWSFKDRNLPSAFCFSSGFSENSFSCSTCSMASFSLASRSSAAAISLPMLSNWEVFLVRISDVSETSSRSDSIFLSIEFRPEEERLSVERISLSCFSAFTLSFVASCLFLRSWTTSFSIDTIIESKLESIKLLIWSGFDLPVKKINQSWSLKSFFNEY